MNSLSISFEPSAGEDRVSARLRRLSDVGGGAVDDKSLDMRLAGNRPKTIRAEPGYYLLEAYWRNGRLTTHQCFVNPTGITKFVIAAPSKQRRSQAAVRDFSQPSAGGMFRTSSRNVEDGNAYAVFSSMPAVPTWDLLCSTEEIGQKSFVISEHRPIRRSVDISMHPAKGAERSWVLYWAREHWSVCSLPTVGGAKSMVLRSNPKGVPFVSVSDPDVSVMTDLLPAGNAEAARRYAFSMFKDMTKDDLDRMVLALPLAVCAFAYAEHENSSDLLWTKAIENMAEHQPLIPDISIILGWRTLVTAKNQDGWMAAGDLFERAVAAGVPYFSLGVRLLAEGLTMLTAEHPRHGTSAKLVRSVAARTVRSEAFTTVSL
jgi:hypothetical protein